LRELGLRNSRTCGSWRGHHATALRLTTVGRSAACAALPPGEGRTILGMWAGGHGRLVRRLAPAARRPRRPTRTLAHIRRNRHRAGKHGNPQSNRLLTRENRVVCNGGGGCALIVRSATQVSGGPVIELLPRSSQHHRPASVQDRDGRGIDNRARTRGRARPLLPREMTSPPRRALRCARSSGAGCRRDSIRTRTNESAASAVAREGRPRRAGHDAGGVRVLTTAGSSGGCAALPPGRGRA
jgi:hypothetical protein